MKRMSALPALSIVAGAALLVTGCAGYAGADPATPSASAAASAAPDPGSLVDAQWRLKTDPSAWFRVQGSNIAGNDSCNSLNGTATALTDGSDRVDFGAGVASTRKYCQDPRGTQTAIREALTGLRDWQRNGSELILSDVANGRSWTFVVTGSPSASQSPSTAPVRR